MRPLDQLEQTIAARKTVGAADSSYTARLLASGVPKIGAKLLEEAGEAASAAGEPGEDGRQHTIYEAGDVLYHLMVLLAARDIALAEVETELARRFKMSGLEEKASRPTQTQADSPPRRQGTWARESKGIRDAEGENTNSH